jgi:phage shock protein A
LAAEPPQRYLPLMLNDIRRLFRKSVEAFRLEVNSNQPEDQVAALLTAMRRELVAARAAIPEFEAALGHTRQQLGREREQLELCDRRGAMATKIGDLETARIAEEFAGKHRQRIAVLEQKVSSAEAELAFHRTEAEEMKRRYQEADANRFVLLAELRRSALKENMRSRLSDDEGLMSDFSRMEERIDRETGYVDALEELQDLDPTATAPPPRPSAQELDARLEELKRRMGK